MKTVPPLVMCDDRNNPPSVVDQKTVVMYTMIDMLSLEGRRIIENMGYTLDQFSKSYAAITIINEIDSNGVVTSTLKYTAPKDSGQYEIMVPNKPVEHITFSAELTKQRATFKDFCEISEAARDNPETKEAMQRIADADESKDKELGEDGRPLGVMEDEWIANMEKQADAINKSEVEFFKELSEVSNNQQSFEDMIRHEPESDFKQLLRDQHAIRNPNYNPQELSKKFAEIGDAVVSSTKGPQNEPVYLKTAEDVKRFYEGSDDTWKTDSEGVASTEEQIKESRKAYVEPYLKQTSEALEPLIKDLDWIEKFEDFCNEHDIDYKTMESIEHTYVKSGVVSNEVDHSSCAVFEEPNIKAKTIKLQQYKDPKITPDSPPFHDWLFGKRD